MVTPGTKIARLSGIARATCLCLCILATGCVPNVPLAVDTSASPGIVTATRCPPAAVIVAVHGLRGTAAAFVQPAVRWADKGIETVAVTVTYPDTQTAVLAKIIRGVIAYRAGTPVFVVGESLGASMILAVLAQPDPPTVAGAILTGPAIWPDGLSAAAMRGGLDAMHFIGGSDFEFWGKVVGLMDDARTYAGQVRTRPILILSGDRDEVVPRLGVTELLRQLHEGVELRTYPAGGHTLFRDAGGDEVADEVGDWVLKHTKARPAVAPGGCARDSAKHS